MTTLTDLLSGAFRGRNWEVNPRKGSRQPRLLHHRFPIKGGLTFGEALMANNRNVLFETYCKPKADQ